jgi:Na+-translocating ferredoxin:NAD+ oxidoreductase RNF subunit RnfB
MMASMEELLEFLPGSDCEQCGMTCAEFANALSRREAAPEDCPALHEPDFAGFIEALHELLGPAPGAVPAMRLDPEKCNGCGICVAMCEYHLGNCDEARLGRGPRPGDKVVFKVVNGQVAVLHLELCTRLIQAAEKCAKCADHCPTGAIILT